MQARLRGAGAVEEGRQRRCLALSSEAKSCAMLALCSLRLRAAGCEKKKRSTMIHM